MALFNKKKTEIIDQQQQKQILAAEKEYKSGLNTLRDLIAPAAFRVAPNFVEISGKMARSFFILSYPRFVSVNWLAPIIGMDVPMDMSMFIYPIDTQEIMKKLRNKVGQLESSMTMNTEKRGITKLLTSETL